MEESDPGGIEPPAANRSGLARTERSRSRCIGEPNRFTAFGLRPVPRGRPLSRNRSPSDETNSHRPFCRCRSRTSSPCTVRATERNEVPLSTSPAVAGRRRRRFENRSGTPASVQRNRTSGTHTPLVKSVSEMNHGGRSSRNGGFAGRAHAISTEKTAKTAENTERKWKTTRDRKGRFTRPVTNAAAFVFQCRMHLASFWELLVINPLGK